MTDRHEDDDIAGELAAMRRYARALARDHHDADDVVQDAVVRAIERDAGYERGRSRRRWLLAIVHNVFVSGLRRRAAERRRDDRFAETLVAHSDAAQELHARLTDIARCFAALPEHQRAVLHLTAVEGLSYQECADLLDVPVGTVMSRLARARTALRELDEQPVPTTALRIVGGRGD
ncbi:sigma-70 family RNA polymerase sigma factor [Sphingopyxis granuli]|jgi:RNA polymerase sigma-70 factor (ECF subfamily)|uniref:sigma-70 family RNA polymerase sigma factor n=1 Tax=Sphingopyxis granuli TaxID=267128 RepID=UPI001BAFE155|nr:sigma-70 family RNA polymerase sigma factor [Sphingopyxis granuli]QUM71286.1 sigma-70 family RNA polymerase sigma factor [Sphingopyxis granuli]